MKKLRLILGLGITVATFSSCIKDEPLNAEADIEQVSVHVDNPLETFFQLSDTMQNVSYADSTITFTVRSQADLTSLAPTFRITEGATISPASGTVRDFSQGPLTYTVTSQDGQWSRLYTLRFNPTYVTVKDTVAYDFEHYMLEPENQAYYVWQEEQADGSLSTVWASGNAGFRLSKASAKPDEYPTYVVEKGRHGYAVACTTRSTGTFGELVNRRIASGNLFLGKFDVLHVLDSLLYVQATQFGIPFDKKQKPRAFQGYYKYHRGAVYQDRDGSTMPDQKDYAAIYAVLYRNQDDKGNSVVLYGDNVKTSPQLVAIADMGDIDDTGDDEWHEFKASFVYKKDLDQETLENRGYSLAIVFSSSKDGDHFKGAIGSTLILDDVRIVCTSQE